MEQANEWIPEWQMGKGEEFKKAGKCFRDALQAKWRNADLIQSLSQGNLHGRKNISFPISFSFSSGPLTLLILHEPLNCMCPTMSESHWSFPWAE